MKSHLHRRTHVCLFCKIEKENSKTKNMFACEERKGGYLFSIHPSVSLSRARARIPSSYLSMHYIRIEKTIPKGERY